MTEQTQKGRSCKFAFLYVTEQVISKTLQHQNRWFPKPYNTITCDFQNLTTPEHVISKTLQYQNMWFPKPYNTRTGDFQNLTTPEQVISKTLQHQNRWFPKPYNTRTVFPESLICKGRKLWNFSQKLALGSFWPSWGTIQIVLHHNKTDSRKCRN